MLPPLNAHIHNQRWEEEVIWSDAESDTSEDEEDEDAEGQQDAAGDSHAAAGGSGRGKKKRKALPLDLNDPAMLFDAGILRPQRAFEVILQQNKGRHRIPNWKLERIAQVLSEHRLANQRGESRFNISNDQVGGIEGEKTGQPRCIGFYLLSCAYANLSPFSSTAPVVLQTPSGC